MRHNETLDVDIAITEQVKQHSATVAAWSSVGLLSALYALAMMDRLVLAMIIQPIKDDFGIGDFQVGLLMGLAFALTYVVSGIPLGILADRTSRKHVIFAGVIVWSLATISSSLAVGFLSLFILRMVVGLGEAALSPAAVPLISSAFPPERRAFPLSIYMGASNVGSAVAALSVGFLLQWSVQHVNNLGVFGITMRPWQFVLVCLGLPGLLLAPLVLFLREPASLAPRQTATLSSLGKFMAKNRRLFVPFFITFAGSVTVNYAFSYWSAEYLIRSLNWSRAEAGALMGFLFFVPPLLSHLISGVIIDYLSKRGVRDAALRLFLYMAFFSLPFSFLAYGAGGPTFSVVGLVAVAFLFYPSLSFGYITLQQVTPDALRGQMTGAFLSFVNFFGLAVGPSLVGYLAQYSFDGANGLGTALAVITSSGILIVCLSIVPCLRPLREAAEAARN